MPATRRIFKRDGVTYQHAYVTTPVCCPSRASIMTGRYAHNTGVEGNKNLPDLGIGGGEALDPATTIQRYLDDGGYATALFGKYLNKWDVSRAPPYFDSFAVISEPKYLHYLVGSGTAGSAPTVFESDVYNTTFVRRRALRFLRKHSKPDQPFFLYVAPLAPHPPFTPQERYADDTFGLWKGNPAVFETDRSDKPPYVRTSHATIADGRKVRTKQFRTLESVDKMVKAIFDQLTATGQARNTLAFFISDNGRLWAEHGLLGKDVPYTPSIEVPFFARWPAGPLAKGSVDRRGGANVDIAPTIMDVAGLTIPSGQPLMDGHSLLDIWKRRREETEHWCDVDRCLYWAAERTATYHYIENYDGPDFDTANVTFREYYNLTNDPFELRNLLHDGDPMNNPDIRTPAARLASDRSCVAAGCP